MNRFILVACIVLTSLARNSVQKDEGKVDKKKDADTCSNLETKFAEKGTYTQTLFVIPRNTAIYETLKVVQSSSGLYVGRFDKLNELNPNQVKHVMLGFTRDSNDGTTIVQYSHINRPNAMTSSRRLGQDKILILNNPLRSLLEGKAPGKINVLRYLTEETPNKIKVQMKDVVRAARAWVDNVKSWIQYTNKDSKILIIEQKDLFSNTKPALEKIHKFLNLEPNPERMNCAIAEFQKYLKNAKTRAKRIDGGVWKKSKTLVEPLKKVLTDGITEINQVLVEYGASRKENVADLQISHKLLDA